MNLDNITKEDAILLEEQVSLYQHRIPTKWTTIQNKIWNNYADKLKFWTWSTFDMMESYLGMYSNGLGRYYTEDEKTYYRHRWYVRICSILDEYYFYSKPGVYRHPDIKSKEYDINIYDNFHLDLKNTRIPKSLVKPLEYWLNHPEELINWYFTNQSTDERYSLNDRLIIVHHSKRGNELKLRGNLAYKDTVFDEYIKLLKISSYILFVTEVENIKTREICYPKGDIIFIIEELDGTLSHKFASDKLNCN